MFNQNISVRKTFEWISCTSYYGIPLDLTLHFVIGAVLTLIGLKLKRSLRQITICLLVVGIAKEVFDSSAMTWTVPGALLDITVSLVFPAGIKIYRLYKGRSRR